MKSKNHLCLFHPSALADALHSPTANAPAVFSRIKP